MRKMENIFENMSFAEKLAEEVKIIQLKLKEKYENTDKETMNEKLDMLKNHFIVSQKQILRATYLEEIEDIITSFVSIWIMSYE